jgi:hypothetical protein
MKRLVILLLIISIFVFASAGVQADAAKKDDVHTIGYQEAIDMGLKNSVSLKLYDDKILIAERKYKNALSDSKDIAKMAWNNANERISNKLVEILVPMQKENSVTELKWQRDNEARNLKLQLISIYYRLQQKNEQIALQSKNIAQAESELKTLKIKVEKGLAAESAVLPMELTVDNAKAELNVLQNEKESMIMEFNSLLGFDIESGLILTTQKIPEAAEVIVDIEKIIEDNLVNAHAVKKLGNDRALAEMEKKIYSDYSMYEKPEQIDELEEKILNLDYQLRDERISIERSIRIDHNNLLNKLDTVKLNKLSYEKAQKQLAVSEKRLNLGLISAIDHNKVSLACDQAQFAYNNALVDYYLTAETFRSNYTVGTSETK